MTESANFDQIKKNLSRSDHWIRLALVVIYALIFLIGLWVLGFVVLLNLIIQLISGERNANLVEFGAKIGSYFSHIMAYATLNSEVRPFPFGDWDATPEVIGTPPPPPTASKASKKKTVRKATAKKTKKKAAKKKTTGSAE